MDAQQYLIELGYTAEGASTQLADARFKTPAATPPAGTGVRSIRRTAGYGPVCPVVWEGRRRETPPYPD